MIEIVFETHSATEDNEAGRATGWLPGRQATDRVGRFLADLSSCWDQRRVVVIGHVATRWGLDRFIDGAALADLDAADFGWRPGWEYLLTTDGA
jgi:broad specificity phosphatase PhoE